MQETLTAEQIEVVKAGAAQRFQQLNIRPATAEYILNRRILKEAKAAGLVPTVPSASKLATAVSNLQKKLAQSATAGCGNDAPAAPAETPAKTEKKEGVKTPPAPKGMFGAPAAPAVK